MKAQYWAVLSCDAVYYVYKVVQIFESEDESVVIQMKAVEQYFPIEFST